MSLYDRCVDLQVKLEAAQSADSNVAVVARADQLVGALDQAAGYFSGVSKLRSAIGIQDRPDLDHQAISRAVSAFRGGLSTHGLTGVQHQPAASLAKTAKAEQDRAARWVAARWRGLFTELEAFLDRVDTGHLVGNPSQRLAAMSAASKLRALRTRDPITDASVVNERLGTSDVGSWLPGIQRLGQELRDSLAALDAESRAMTPEVRSALEHSSSEGGLPLEDVTAELLAALHAAAVDAHLVVRRR